MEQYSKHGILEAMFRIISNCAPPAGSLYINHSRCVYQSYSSLQAKKKKINRKHIEKSTWKFTMCFPKIINNSTQQSSTDTGPITAGIAPPPPESGHPISEDLENSFSKMGLSTTNLEPLSIDEGPLQLEPVTSGVRPPMSITGASLDSKAMAWLPDCKRPPPPITALRPQVGPPLTVKRLTGPPVITIAPQPPASGSHMGWSMPVMEPLMTMRLPMLSMQPAMQFPVTLMQTSKAGVQSPPAMGPLIPARESLEKSSLYDKLRPYCLTQDQLWENNYVQFNQEREWKVKSTNKPPENPNDHKCVRCHQHFQMGPDNKIFVPKNTPPCSNHYGKLRRKGCHSPRYWTCCDKKAGEPNCTKYPHHVHSDNILYGALSEELNGQVCPVGFVCTPANPQAYRNVVAMDCEMVYTTGGCEVAKVTLIDENLNVLLDWYVRPRNRIIDYCTMFSGITENEVSQTPEERPQQTLCDVQKELLQHIHADTIIVGHSLENDLKALRIIHSNVVDTAVVFKLNRYKRSLKDLSKEHLDMEIQTVKSGHCSKEDAVATLSLMKHKLGLPFK